MKRLPFRAVVILGALLGGPSVPADVVYLKNGKSIEGVVERDRAAGTVSIRKANSIVLEIPEEEIARDSRGRLRIEKRKPPVEVFRERLRQLPEGRLEPLVELAAWAREKRLRSQVREVAGMILRIDPNHEMARKELGYVVFENAWVLEAELRKNRRERGLVKFQGRWMKETERQRLLREQAAREIRDLMDSLVSKNRYVQAFAVRKLMAYRDAHGRAVFASFLDDPRELVRIMAASALTNFPVRDERREDRDAARITARLYTLLLGPAERSDSEREALYLSLRLFQPRESFRLAVETLTTSREEREISRASKVAHRTLLKAQVPTLCRAVVVERAGRKIQVPAVRAVLERALGVDHGYDVRAWLRWWRTNEARFTDEP